MAIDLDRSVEGAGAQASTKGLDVCTPLTRGCLGSLNAAWKRERVGCIKRGNWRGRNGEHVYFILRAPHQKCN
jgi:hypothetical protein